MTKLTKMRNARDRWEAACPVAFVIMFPAAISWPTLGPWPALLAIVVFMACNIGFFYCDARLDTLRRIGLTEKRTET